jgi:hypothetical protein
MNRNFRITYRSVALARLIFVLAAFILSKLYSDSLPKTGFFAGGINLHFEWWQDAIIILIFFAFAFVVLFQLTVSLSPQFAPALLQRKAIVWSAFIIELLTAGFLGYMAADEIQRYFFPRPRSILDTLLSPLFPTNVSTILIGKWQAVTVTLLAVCSAYLAVFIWKYRKYYPFPSNTNIEEAAAEQ